MLANPAPRTANAPVGGRACPLWERTCPRMGAGTLRGQVRSYTRSPDAIREWRRQTCNNRSRSF